MRKHDQDTKLGYKFGDHLLLASGCLLKYQTPHIEMIEMIEMIKSCPKDAYLIQI